MAETIPSLDGVNAEDLTEGLPQFAIDTWIGQIFWLVLTFGILYFILSRFILPRIGEGLTERSDRVADDLDTASRMQKEAEQAEIAYNRSFADAKAKAHNIAETTRKSVDAEIEVEVAAAEAEFASNQTVADARIHKLKAAALAKIDSVAIDTTSALVEKLINTKPGAATVKAAVSRVRG